MVYAVRTKRKEGVWKRAAYATFYRVMRFMAKIEVPLDSGDFCLMDRCVVDVMTRLPERNRFLRGLRSWVGFRQTGLVFERAERFAGDPKYTLRGLIRLALSGFIGFSSMPLRLGAWLGFAAALIGMLMTLWVFYTKLFGEPAPHGWASTSAIILFMGGCQLLVLGVIGEYLGNVNDEVRRRPLYVTRERVGGRDNVGSRAETGRV